MAAVVYAASFFYIALVFALLRWYATANHLMGQHRDVGGIRRQYAVGPLMYVALIGIAAWSGVACLVVSTLYGVYFALPPRLWRRERRSNDIASLPKVKTIALDQGSLAFCHYRSRAFCSFFSQRIWLQHHSDIDGSKCATLRVEHTHLRRNDGQARHPARNRSETRWP